jgi:hypothetical protein
LRIQPANHSYPQKAKGRKDAALVLIIAALCLIAAAVSALLCVFALKTF